MNFARGAAPRTAGRAEGVFMPPEATAVGSPRPGGGFGGGTAGMAGAGDGSGGNGDDAAASRSPVACFTMPRAPARCSDGTARRTRADNPSLGRLFPSVVSVGSGVSGRARCWDGIFNAGRAPAGLRGSWVLSVRGRLDWKVGKPSARPQEQARYPRPSHHSRPPSTHARTPLRCTPPPRSACWCRRSRQSWRARPPRAASRWSGASGWAAPARRRRLPARPPPPRPPPAGGQGGPGGRLSTRGTSGPPQAEERARA